MTTTPTNTTPPQSAWKGPYFAECGNLWLRNPDGILVAIGCARGEDDERDEEFVAERLAALLNAGAHADAMYAALERALGHLSEVNPADPIRSGWAIRDAKIALRAALTSAREGQ